MITYFKVPYETFPFHYGPARRLVINEFYNEIRETGGFAEESEIDGNQAIVRMRAPKNIVNLIKNNFSVEQLDDPSSVWTPTRTKHINRGGELAFDSGQIETTKTLDQLNRCVLSDQESGELQRLAENLIARADQEGYVKLVGYDWEYASKVLGYLGSLGYPLNRVSTGTFPTTGILDNFNRANEGPPPSANWDYHIQGVYPLFKVVSNECVEHTVGGGGRGYWKTSFAADQEARFTFASIPTAANFADGAVWMRLKDVGSGGTTGETTVDGYLHLWINPAPGSNNIQYHRLSNGGFAQLLGNESTPNMANGNMFGADIIGSTHTAYRNVGAGWIAMPTRTDGTHSNAGFIGLGAGEGSPRFEDFGGGAVVTDPNAYTTTRKIIWATRPA